MRVTKIAGTVYNVHLCKHPLQSQESPIFKPPAEAPSTPSPLLYSDLLSKQHIITLTGTGSGPQPPLDTERKGSGKTANVQ